MIASGRALPGRPRRLRIVKDVTHFDAASAEPPHPAARAALLAAFDEGWADPARLYRAGRQARMLLDSSRAAVAEVLGWVAVPFPRRPHAARCFTTRFIWLRTTSSRMKSGARP